MDEDQGSVLLKDKWSTYEFGFTKSGNLSSTIKNTAANVSGFIFGATEVQAGENMVDDLGNCPNMIEGPDGDSREKLRLMLGLRLAKEGSKRAQTITQHQHSQYLTLHSMTSTTTNLEFD